MEAKKPEWEKYQAEANKIWAKHPDWEDRAVLRQMKKKFPELTERTSYRKVTIPLT